VLLTETIRTSGLGSGLSAALSGWHKPTAVHDPAKIVLDLAVTLASGGDCLADLAVLRAEPGVYGRVASDPAVSRTIDVDAAPVGSHSEKENAKPRGRVVVAGVGQGCGCQPETPMTRGRWRASATSWAQGAFSARWSRTRRPVRARVAAR
jgi:hypothetical protein